MVTNDNRLVFSLKAPTHPVNPIINVTAPKNVQINPLMNFNIN